MKSILSLFLILICISTSSFASEKDKIADAVTVLNDAAYEWLGISLEALSFLTQSGDGSFLPESYLVSSKKLALVQQLEKAGYIKIERRVGLPDGQVPDESFVRIIPTQTGMTVIASVRVVSTHK